MPVSLADGRRLLRTEPAAQYCGSTKSTLDKRRVRGQPPAFIKLGKTVVYDTRDLDEWLTSCRRQSTSESATPAPWLLPRDSAATSGHRPRRSTQSAASLTGGSATDRIEVTAKRRRQPNAGGLKHEKPKRARTEAELRGLRNGNEKRRLEAIRRREEAEAAS